MTKTHSHSGKHQPRHNGSADGNGHLPDDSPVPGEDHDTRARPRASFEQARAEPSLEARIDQFVHRQPALAALMAFSIGIVALSLIGKRTGTDASVSHAE
jgi:hypothetical protein